MQPGHPFDPVGQSRCGQPSTLAVLDMDVVVVLGPVVSYKHFHHHLLIGSGEPEATSSVLIVQCSLARHVDSARSG